MKKIFLALILSLSCTFVLADSVPPISQDQVIKPPALQPGDTIAFVTPARMRDWDAVVAAKEELERRGYIVRTDLNIRHEVKYLGGTDEERAHSINAAFADPTIDAVFPVTGGYGTTRILDDIDWGVIRANPKVVIGYSDVTALHLAMLKKSGVVSFHAPYPTYMYAPRSEGETRDYSFAEKYFWGTITGDPSTRVIETDDLTTPPVVIEPGVGRGPLTGGNLTLVATLMGTPYEMETDGRILFFEDIGEAPYRIDRMLSTLELAGKLDNLAGVVLGRFRGCEPDDPEREFTLDEIFTQYFANRGYPVVYQFPLGHVRENATFPLGIEAELNTRHGTLTLLETAVAPRK